MKAGDRLVSEGPCGGGYGDPLQRDPNSVRDDVLDGYLTAESALADYGVVIDRRGSGRRGDDRGAGAAQVTSCRRLSAGMSFF